MRLPPNYGADYTEKFQQVFGEVAGAARRRSSRSCSTVSPRNRAYFLSDGVHPAAAAQPFILDTVWKELRPLLKK